MEKVDTSRWFGMEGRVVFMTPPAGPEAIVPKAEAVSEVKKAEQPATTQEEFEEKKNSFYGKVGSAQYLIEDVRKIYVDESEGVDKSTENDPVVLALYEKLNAGLSKITTEFETRSAEIKDLSTDKLAKIDAELVASVLTEIGSTETKDLYKGVEDEAAKAAGVKSVKALNVDISKFIEKHEEDERAFGKTKNLVDVYENKIAAITALADKPFFKGKNVVPLKALLEEFRKKPEYQKGLQGKDLDPVKLDAERDGLKKDFDAKITSMFNSTQAFDKELIRIRDEYRKEVKGKLIPSGNSIEVDMSKANGDYRLGEKSQKAKISISQPGDPIQNASAVIEFQRGLMDKATFENEANFRASSYNRFVPLPELGKSLTKTVEDHTHFSDGSVHYFPSETSHQYIVSRSTDGKITVETYSVARTETIPLDKPLSQLTIENLEESAVRTPKEKQVDTHDKEKPPADLGPVGETNWTDLETGDTSGEKPTAESTSETVSHAPEASTKMAEGLLANPKAPVVFESGKTLSSESLAALGIVNPQEYKTEASLKEDAKSGEAYLVFDHTNTTFTQEFADEATFKKNYPKIQLPEKGKSATARDSIFLGRNRPEPYAGLRRQSELAISVDKTGKITVKVTNILFGDPPDAKVYVPLRKSLKDIKSTSDILYPPGYAPESEGKESAVSTSERSAKEDTEKGEEMKSLEEYDEQLKKYEEGAKTIEKFSEAQFKDLPKFLQEDVQLMQAGALKGKLGYARSEVDGAKILKEDDAHRDEKMMNIKSAMDELAKYEDFFEKSGIENLPQVKEMRNGIVYGGAGRSAKYFDMNFEDANDILELHFKNRDAGHEDPYADVVGAKIICSGGGKFKVIRGYFEIKAPHSDKPVRFDFNKKTGATWEEAVANAMRDMTKDEDVNDQMDDQKDRLDDINETRDRVDAREARHLERRERLTARLEEKYPGDNNKTRRATEKDRAIEKTADYEAETEAEIRQAIKKDFGNPDQYEYRDLGANKHVAIRIVPRKGVKPVEAVLPSPAIKIAETPPTVVAQAPAESTSPPATKPSPNLGTNNSLSTPPPPA